MLRFNLDDNHNRTARDWFHAGAHSVMTNARKHAEKHGAAGIWRANDSFLLLYRDGDAIRQKTWKHAVPNNAR